MCRKNQNIDLSIICSGILISLFSLILGSSVYVYASTTPDYLIDNLSINNVTASQILEINDKIVNYTKHFVKESKGNLTKMNMLIFDDLEKRNIINEKEKQELLSLDIALSKNKPTSNLTLIDISNLTLIDRNVSSLLEEMVSNSSNPLLVTLKSTLKNKIHDIGTNVGTLIAGNGTGNVTGGITGLPPLTIGDFWDDSNRGLRLTLGCQALGTAITGMAIGSYIGGICSVIII